MALKSLMPRFARVQAAAGVRGYAEGKGLVLGAYDGCFPGEFVLTDTGAKFNEDTSGKLAELLKGANLKRGTAQVFTNLSHEYGAVAVSGLGKEEAGYDSLEVLDEWKENVRVAAGVGASALQERGVENIMVEGFRSSESSAEGALLALWRYQDQKNEQAPPTRVDLFEDPDREGWQRGMIKADCQNLARRLEETPSNLMTPAIFSKKAIDILCPCGIQIDVRDKDWLETKKMSAFLSMARGSCEPPLLLEIGYCGGPVDDKPVILTGKGSTFDSGGLCRRACKKMADYRADMAGAAVTLGVLKAVAALSLPINVYGLVPLCENMPGGLALKPGDVVLGLNGKTIRVESTDHEGRVVLADTIAHSAVFKPCLVIDLATMSGSTRKSLGGSATATFATSDVAWKELSRAGAETGDRLWRLPLWRHFALKVTDYTGVDVNNVGKGEGGAACLAASFLMEFVPAGVDFVHLDITGTGMVSAGIGFPYLKKGLMTGRPTRTVTQFLYQMACPNETVKHE